MTIFFDFDAIVRKAKCNPLKVVELLKNSPIKGNSYLLKPDRLLNDKTTDILYIYQYLLLASKRDYAYYTMYGLKTLPLSHYKDLNLDSLRTNPLLTITKTEIHFNYEE